MSKTATKRVASGKRSQTSAKKPARPVSTAQHAPAVKSYAYDERVPIIADVLRHAKRSMSVRELFAELATSKTGLFGKERRVAATFRADQRADSPVFERGDGNTITLRHAKRATSNGKSGNVSRKATKRAK